MIVKAVIKQTKILFCLASLSFVLINQVLADEISIQDEIVVTAQRLSSAMRSGNYYLMNYYYGLLAKQRWELEQARARSQNGSSQTPSSNDNTQDDRATAESCDVFEVRKEHCQQRALSAFSQNIRTCRYPSMIGIGEQCRAEKEAEHRANMQSCQLAYVHNLTVCLRQQP